jgi:peptide/nickel transport system ATP-binding protein
VVQYISDRVVVMKDARIVEEADHREIWRAPKTDYTRKLIRAASGPGRYPEPLLPVREQRVAV